MRSSFRTLIFSAFSAAFALGLAVATPVQEGSDATGEAAARALVVNLNDALLAVMRKADALTYDERFERFAAFLPDIYDFRRMAGVAVGRSAWSSMSADERDAYARAFANLSAATYAARFDGWNDNAFFVDAVEAGRGGFLVKTRLTRPDKDAVELDYRVRVGEEGARIVDVLYNGGVSELAQKRAEFSAAFREGGYDGLIAAIEDARERVRS